MSGDFGIIGHSAKAISDQHAALEAIVRSKAHAEFLQSAGGAAEALFEHIRAFEAATDPSMDVGVRLVSFGQAVTFHVASVGYTQPNLVWFEGKLDDGSPVRLIQHLSQLSFLLMRVPRLAPDDDRKPIGFHHSTDSAKG